MYYYLEHFLCSFYVSDLYLMMAKLENRNILQFIIKVYCIRYICCVWSDNWHIMTYFGVYGISSVILKSIYD